MNKFWHLALNALVIVLLWWGALSLFARYRVNTYGVAPTFPYYNSLLSYVSAPTAVWGHFDGAHYLKLANYGYIDQGTQAFFPVYPLLIRLFHFLGISYFTAAIVLNLTCLVFILIALHYLYGKSAWSVGLILLIFPTSFYLAAIYTESLFLLQTVIFFILVRDQRYTWAALVAGLASGTRLVGALLVISLFIEISPHLKRRPFFLILLPLSLSGLIGYTYFLWQKFGDPLAFVHVQSMFGAGRSGGEIIMLPQVIYRYLKIFLTVSPISLLFQRAALELVVTGTFLIMLIRRWRRIPLSWSVYILGSLLIPTLSGTLSSLPRYTLVLLPFIISPPKFMVKYMSVALASVTLLLVLLSLFVSGQFVA